MQRTKKITAFVLAIALCVGMLQTLGVNAKAADTVNIWTYYLHMIRIRI